MTTLNPLEDGLITVNDLSKILKKSPASIRVGICSKTANLPPIVRIGRLIRFRLSGVQKFIEDNTEKRVENE